MWAVKVVAVITVAGNVAQAISKFLNDYPGRVEGQFATQGVVGVVNARTNHRPWDDRYEFYPKASIVTALPFQDAAPELRDLRDFLVADLEAWLEGEGHTVHEMHSDAF